ncbi:MAG: heme exporter protein CcmD [Betaproteobacteria bacterium]|nr:heme exporter protein CcmD [Betaproteobacteria bacterium]
MSDFLHMGGYGFYVWSAYGSAVLAVVAEIVAVKRRLRAARDATSGIDRSGVA